jgi:hypothetical protein
MVEIIIALFIGTGLGVALGFNAQESSKPVDPVAAAGQFNPMDCSIMCKEVREYDHFRKTCECK